MEGGIGATGNGPVPLRRGREQRARGHRDGAGPRSGTGVLGLNAAVLANNAVNLVRDDLSGFDVVVHALSAAPVRTYGVSSSPPGWCHCRARPRGPAGICPLRREPADERGPKLQDFHRP